MQGTIETWVASKGYGFIRPDSGGKDVFVHCSNVKGSGIKNLEPGQVVEYELGEGKKGEQAVNVSVRG